MHNNTTTKTQLQQHNHTITKTPHTTTTSQKHNHTNTKTQPHHHKILAAELQPDNHKNTTAQPQEHNHTTTRQKHKHKDRHVVKEIREVFFCTLLACHEGRGRSPSVSGIGEKTDFLTFQLNFKNIHQIKQHCKQTSKRRGRDGSDLRIKYIHGVVTVRCKGVMGVSKYHTDGGCIGTGSQCNRRNDVRKCSEKPRMTK